MKHPFFSIALLGHQSEPYLRMALQSVENQSYPNFECLIIVEESTDNSLAICSEIAARDTRFRVISLPESGSGAMPRNYAMDHATGAYLVFLDGDDQLAPDLLSSVATVLEQSGRVDLLLFDAQEMQTFPDGSLQLVRRICPLSESNSGKVMTGRELILKTGHSGAFHSFSWLHVCRRKFLLEHGLYQSPGLVLEDFEWSMRSRFFAEKAIYLAAPLYNYLRHDNSATTGRTARMLFDAIREFSRFVPFLKSHPIEEKILRIWANQWISLIVWNFFNPIYDVKITMKHRREARKLLLSPGTVKWLVSFTRRSSLMKQIGMCLFLLPGETGLKLSMCYFRWVYFPLLNCRRRA